MPKKHRFKKQQILKKDFKNNKFQQQHISKNNRFQKTTDSKKQQMSKNNKY